MNRNIEIHVRTDTPDKKTQVQQDNDAPTKHPPENQNVIKNARMLSAAGLAIGKRAAMDYSSRIGDRTGQRGRQQRISNAMNVASTLTNLAIGAKFGIVGFGIAAGYETYNAITRNIDIDRDRSQEEVRRNYYRDYAIMVNRSGRTGGAL